MIIHSAKPIKECEKQALNSVFLTVTIEQPLPV